MSGSLWMVTFCEGYNCDDVHAVVCTTRDLADRLAAEFGGFVELAAVDYVPEISVHYAVFVNHWAPEGQPQEDHVRERGIPDAPTEVREPIWPWTKEDGPVELQIHRACAHWWDGTRYWPYVDVRVYGPEARDVEQVFRWELKRLSADWVRGWWALADETEREVARAHWLRGQSPPQPLHVRPAEPCPSCGGVLRIEQAPPEENPPMMAFCDQCGRFWDVTEGKVVIS